MRRTLTVLAAAVVTAGVAWGGDWIPVEPPKQTPAPAKTPEPIAEFVPDTPSFSMLGAKVGDKLPQLKLQTADNDAATLWEANAAKPTVIMTASYTCPKSREKFPEYAALAEKFKDRYNFTVLYVIEAHPVADPSPYRKGLEEVTEQNFNEKIFYRQPRKMEKRMELAAAFKKAFGVKMPILVDSMENEAWKSVGGGPNMALVVDGSGKVTARQGWFDAAKLQEILANVEAAAK